MNCFVRSRYLKAALKILLLWAKIMAAIFGSVFAIAFVVAGIAVFFDIHEDSETLGYIFAVVFVSYIAAVIRYFWDRPL